MRARDAVRGTACVRLERSRPISLRASVRNRRKGLRAIHIELQLRAARTHAPQVGCARRVGERAEITTEQLQLPFAATAHPCPDVRRGPRVGRCGEFAARRLGASRGPRCHVLICRYRTCRRRRRSGRASHNNADHCPGDRDAGEDPPNSRSLLHESPPVTLRRGSEPYYELICPNHEAYARHRTITHRRATAYVPWFTCVTAQWR